MRRLIEVVIVSEVGEKDSSDGEYGIKWEKSEGGEKTNAKK